MTRDVGIGGRPADDETAAILAAIQEWFTHDQEQTARGTISEWALAGRREAQGLPTGRNVIRTGWGR